MSRCWAISPTEIDVISPNGTVLATYPVMGASFINGVAELGSGEILLSGGAGTFRFDPATGAVTRLRDMGVEPFLLSSSLIGVLAQRLVRVLDDETKIPHEANEYECNLLGVDPAKPPTLYKPGDGPNNGFIGRTGIYELIAIDEDMRTMIHDGASEQDLDRHARKFSTSIRGDGRRRVLAGETTLEEVLRVTRED